MYEFTVAIQESAWKSTPTIKRMLKGLNFPKEILDKIVEKRKLRKRWYQTRALTDTDSDKNALNRATNQSTREFRKIKKPPVNSFLSKVTADSSTNYSLWKATIYLKGPKIQVPALRKDSRNWARNNQERADAFAEHLQNQFQPNPGLSTLPELQRNDYSDTISLVTTSEVAEEIRYLNSKKGAWFRHDYRYDP